MDDLDSLIPQHTPTAARPLLGLTVLAVEDSRFASDALRLMCLRSGARIRRADSLASAERHLRVYRPTAIIVDIGLPDGSGLELIETLNAANPRVPVLMATSGDPDLRARALELGADGFLDKPAVSLAAFQTAILAHLPNDQRPNGPRAITRDEVAPDPAALADDLAHAAALLADDPDAETRDYAAQFVVGLADWSGDAALKAAAQDVVAQTSDTALVRLRGMLEPHNGASVAV